MSELKEEELLEHLEFMFTCTKGMADSIGKPLYPAIEQTYEQIIALIKKPKVTEKWIEEKAKAVWNLWWYKASGKYTTDLTGTIRFDFTGIKNLIRSLLKELK